MSKNIEEFVIARINELMAARNWTCYKLSSMSDVSLSSLNGVLKTPHIPTIYTLQKLCNGFGISISEFFSPFEQSSSKDFVELYNLLDKESQNLVLIYMKGLGHIPINSDENI